MIGGPITPGGWPRHQRVRATDTPGHWRVLSSWRLRDYDRQLWAVIERRRRKTPAAGEADDSSDDFPDDIVIVKLYPDDADAMLYAATCGALGPHNLERHADDICRADEPVAATDEAVDAQERLW